MICGGRVEACGYKGGACCSWQFSRLLIQTYYGKLNSIALTNLSSVLAAISVSVYSSSPLVE